MRTFLAILCTSSDTWPCVGECKECVSHAWLAIDVRDQVCDEEGTACVQASRDAYLHAVGAGNGQNVEATEARRQFLGVADAPADRQTYRHDSDLDRRTTQSFHRLTFRPKPARHFGKETKRPPFSGTAQHSTEATANAGSSVCVCVSVRACARASTRSRCSA
jgi:hypothetical protein